MTFGQYEPSGQGAAADELIGQNCEREHALGEVDPVAQYDPAGHTKLVLVFWQYHPSGQGVFAIDPGGQKLPALHADFNDGEEQ